MEFELPADFRELLESLNENGVEYLVVGGYAVGMHGYYRSTMDPDIFVADSYENANRIVKALTQFGFGDTTLTADLFTQKDSLVVIGVEPLAVDILNYLSGVQFKSAFERRTIHRCEDVDVNVIGLDDLIINKTAAGRLKDLADVGYLRNIHSQSPDSH
jgi:hypothetical protein